MIFPSRVWMPVGDSKFYSRTVTNDDLIRRIALCEHFGWHYDGPEPRKPKEKNCEA